LAHLGKVAYLFEIEDCINTRCQYFWQMRDDENIALLLGLDQVQKSGHTL
jgi:hypothetical protein